MALAGRVAAQSPLRYEIAAMPVRDALVSLARQSGVSISFEDFDLEGYRSGYVYGASSVADALEIILSRTPYAYEFTGDDTIRLTLRPPDARNALSALVRADAGDVILVTATKREADARTLPVSISAIGHDSLVSWGATDVSDLAPKVAGVAFTNLGTSRNKIFVRGLSDGPFADRTQSTVGVYLNETPIILNDTNPDLRLIDMERVEIVRGPQGSLYGGGSIGGLFRMITAKPDLEEYSARAQLVGSVTRGGEDNASGDGVVNLPLVRGVLGARGVAYYQRLGGYIDDVGLGQDDVNSSQIYGGRFSLRYRPTDRWTVDGLFTRQLVNLDGAQYVFSGFNGLTRETQREEPYRDAFNLVNVTVKGAFGGADLTSSTSYIRRRTGDELDASAALPDILSLPDEAGVYHTRDKINSFVHETRLASSGDGPWRWLAGAFFESRNENLISRLVVDSLSPPLTPFYSDRRDETAETALFGELAYSFSNGLGVTFGARLARTTYSVDAVSSGEIYVGDPVIDVKNTAYTVSPKLAFTYQTNPDLLIYAQLSHGSRIGGVNVTTPLAAFFDIDADADTTIFESDSLWNAETGVKSNWLDGALSLNASIFYVIWNDVQTDQYLPHGFSFIANAGRARNYGFELESVIRPVDNLELTAAFFWNTPELREANPFLGARRGDALPNIADVSAGLSATYALPLSAHWNATLSGDINYVGRSFLTFREDVAPPMGDYFEGNVRLSFARGDFQAGIFVDNIANERGNTFSFGNPFSLSVRAQETPLRPRTTGVFLRKEF